MYNYQKDFSKGVNKMTKNSVKGNKKLDLDLFPIPDDRKGNDTVRVKSVKYSKNKKRNISKDILIALLGVSLLYLSMKGITKIFEVIEENNINPLDTLYGYATELTSEEVTPTPTIEFGGRKHG